MANANDIKASWDFECPQFVDFASGLNNSGREDVYFDCQDSSAVFEDCVKNLSTPDDTVKSKCLTKKDENKLMERMEAALSIIENTPKVGAVKGKFTLKSCNRQIVKTTSKAKPVHVRPSTMSRSKSVTALNRIADKPSKVKGLRKRSSSLNDLRIKKHTYPMTPMCLKRTIVKAKAKVIKTTEEMELEEIAKLQKQLIQHLRYNEISMKKLRLKPRVYTNQKSAQTKQENLKENKAVERAFNPFMEKTNVEKEREKIAPGQRQNIQKLSHAAVKKVAIKMESIMGFKVPSNKASHKVTKENLPSTSKNPSVASSFVSESIEEDKVHGHKKPVNAGKMHGFHSGLLFAENVRKVTVVKPFNFNKAKEINSAEASREQNVDAWSSSVMNHKIGEGKENIHVAKVQPNSKNIKGVQSTSRFDFSKLPGSNKKGENRNMNQMRGLALYENFARN